MLLQGSCLEWSMGYCEIFAAQGSNCHNDGSTVIMMALECVAMWTQCLAACCPNMVCPLHLT